MELLDKNVYTWILHIVYDSGNNWSVHNRNKLLL